MVMPRIDAHIGLRRHVAGNAAGTCGPLGVEVMAGDLTLQKGTVVVHFILHLPIGIIEPGFEQAGMMRLQKGATGCVVFGQHTTTRVTTGA
jgi:hypothetical protein